MTTDAPPSDEAARLAALERYAILDSVPEAGFDRIARLAATLFDVPIALVSFVGEDRQWFKAKVGMMADATPRAIALCDVAIRGKDVLVVPDAERDARFADNPLVRGEPNIRFYAGAPLLTPDGFALGTVCVVDTAPRPALSDAERRALADLADAVMSELELRREVSLRQRKAEALAESEAAFRQLFEKHPAPMWIYDRLTLGFLEVNEAATETYGWPRETFLRMSVLDVRPPEDRARVRDAIRDMPETELTSGPWRHSKASGEVMTVRTVSRPVEFNGHAAVLATVWDETDRVRAETSARDLAARLHTTFESIDDGLYTLDREWRFTYINGPAEPLLRRPSRELLGRVLWDEYPDAAQTEAYGHFHRAVRDRVTVRFEFYFPPFDVSFDCSAFPSAEGLTVLFRDVTERRRHEQRLRLLEAAVARLNDIVLITEAEPIDPPGPRIVFVNDAFERRTGYTAAEVMGKSPRLLQGRGTDRRELDRIRAAMAAWKPVRSEVLNYTKSGEALWLELDIVPIADAGGWYTHWVAVERDVTERKTAAIALFESEERFRIVAHATGDVIWDWNVVADTIWWSDTLADRFGYDGHGAPPTFAAWAARVHPGDRARIADALRTVTEGPAKDWSAEYRFLRADDSVAQIVHRGSVIRGADGRALRMVGSVSDVTAQRELSEQLRQSQRLEAIGQLTGGVAHDFNNLLTVILGNAELLAEGLVGDPPLRAMAEMTKTAAERGAELTHRLLAFARRQTLDPKAIDVGALLSGMDGLLRRALGAHIEIALVRPPALWSAVVDAPQLENAVLNLCLNARDAMPDGGRLTIEAAGVTLDGSYADANTDVTPGDYVMIAVSDIGTGMQPEVAARAFDPFFTTKQPGRGSGLGLSQVFGFVKQSNGHVKIYSEPGHGTTVRIYLPRGADAAEVERPPAAPEIARRGFERILLVEDDDLVRRHVTAQLADLGYDVTSARDGPDALAVLGRAPPFDLLFTDVMMPGGLSGRQLADLVKVAHPALPVLFTSGYAQDAIVHQGRLDPGVHLLQKPYRARDLAAKVRAIFDGAP